MDSLHEAERAKYEATWRASSYRQVCHGLNLWKSHRHLFPAKPGNGLDIGCGTGRLIAQWQQEHIVAEGIDIADNAADDLVRPFVTVGCLWDRDLWDTMFAQFDMACCADVMEHIPPGKVQQVLEGIHDLCDVVVYKIANFPSVHEGRNLHLTMMPAAWWTHQLCQFGNVTFEPGRFGVDEYIFRVETVR